LTRSDEGKRLGRDPIRAVLGNLVGWIPGLSTPPECVLSHHLQSHSLLRAPGRVYATPLPTNGSWSTLVEIHGQGDMALLDRLTRFQAADEEGLRYWTFPCPSRAANRRNAGGLFSYIRRRGRWPSSARDTPTEGAQASCRLASFGNVRLTGLRREGSLRWSQEKGDTFSVNDLGQAAGQSGRSRETISRLPLDRVTRNPSGTGAPLQEKLAVHR
jgi:hypothetical protein